VNEHCLSVDTKCGLSYYCGTCNREVEVRSNGVFTVRRFNKHCKFDVQHRESVRNKKALALLEPKKKSAGIELYSLEKSTLAQLNKKQAPMMSFLKKRAPSATKEPTAKKPTPLTSTPLNLTVDTVDLSAMDESSRKSATCNCVLSDFRKK